MEMTITSSMNTFCNTGNNIPTLHQPTVTVTTITHTHWLPTVTDPHQVWFLALYTLTTYCKTLQNALGVKTVNARENLWVCINSLDKPVSIVVCWFQRTLKQLEQEQTDTHTHTDTQDNYSNPRACVPRVNNEHCYGNRFMCSVNPPE